MDPTLTPNINNWKIVVHNLSNLLAFTVKFICLFDIHFLFLTPFRPCKIVIQWHPTSDTNWEIVIYQ